MRVADFERMNVGPHHIRHLDRSSVDPYFDANPDSAVRCPHDCSLYFHFIHPFEQHNISFTALSTMMVRSVRLVTPQLCCILLQLLILYYSHSCGHSGNFLPHYAAESNRAAELNISVKFTSLNCGRPGNNEHCSRVGVSRYPSVSIQYCS